MLKDYKYFHSAQFPHKANYLIYLKSPKTNFGSFFDHFFVIFATWEFYRKKNPTLSFTFSYQPLIGPLVPSQVSETTEIWTDPIS